MQTRDIFVVLFFFTMVSIVHMYVGWRLMAVLAHSSQGRMLIGLAMGASVIVVFFSFALRRTGPEHTQWLMMLEWTGYLVLGFMLVLFPLFLVTDLLVGFGVITHKIFDFFQTAPGAVDNPTRRMLLLRATGMIAVAAAAVSSTYGFVEARRVPRVKYIKVPLTFLPKELEQLRIAQVSDIHIGPTIKHGFLQAVVDEINSLEPDIVAITGDLVDGYPFQLRGELAPLANLTPKQGTYFVTGNHEYYWGAEEWIAEVEKLGITTLRNDHRVLDFKGRTVIIAGVYDISAHTIRRDHRSDPKKALEGAPEADLKVLLAHQPRTAFAARNVGYHIQLSGHTHGGQFFPWTIFVYLVQPVVAGLKKLGKMWVYVNRGTGYWGPPVRVGAPSEITLLTFVSTNRGEAVDSPA